MNSRNTYIITSERGKLFLTADENAACQFYRLIARDVRSGYTKRCELTVKYFDEKQLAVVEKIVAREGVQE